MARDLEALFRFLADRASMPFRPGRNRNDCVSFSAKAAEAQTGGNPLGDLRWSSLREGRQLLATLGGLEQAVDDRLARIAPAMAQRGDIGAIPDDRFGLRLMVVEGATLVGPGALGNARVPRAAMVAAWSLDPVGGTG